LIFDIKNFVILLNEKLLKFGKNMKILIILSFTLISVLWSCSDNTANPDYIKDFETISNLDLKAAIALCNDWKDSNPKITSFITPQELTIKFPDGREVKKSIPTDSMYVAIAPYINETHTCSTHYMSSCQAELTGKTFKLTAKDDKEIVFIDGNVISLKNGFFEIWLPRNKTFKLHIEYNSNTCDGIITTNDNSNTCITTLKLK
jgi:hypothetical protein